MILMTPGLGNYEPYHRKKARGRALLDNRTERGIAK